MSNTERQTVPKQSDRKWLGRLKIRHRLLLSYSALWLLVALISSAAVYFIVRQTLLSDIEKHMETTTDAIVELVRSSAQAAVRNRLRTIAGSSLEIAGHFHRQARLGLMTDQEARRQAEEMLLRIRIGESGYIYCLNTRGIIEVHPKEGLRLADLSSYDFIQDQIERRQGYLEYEWQNPDDTSDRPKALYMEYFEPWDWIISASSYRTEFTSLLEVDDFRDRIISLRFHETGYPFVIDGAGNVVMHPVLEDNVLDVTDADGRFFIRDICAARNGTISYSWKNPGETEYRAKLAVFRYLPEFDWIVVASSYRDEYLAPLVEIRTIFFATTLGTLFLLIPLSIAVSSTITKPIERLVRRLQRGAEGDFSVRAATGSGAEIGRLAHFFNLFMTHLEEGEATRERMEEERERITARLRQSEKMQAVGQLAGGMAHDFNNILAAVVGHTDLMLASDMSPENRTRAEHIVTAAERAASLTRTLLDFSRRGAVRSVVVDIRDMITEVVELLSHSIDKRIAIENEIADEVLPVRGDPGRLQNMLLNLAINARDAMPEGGRLSFAARRCTQEEWAAAELSDAPIGCVRITVTDTGPGIDPSIVPRVFDPFFTTKEAGEGTGLGLTSAYGCARGHGGAIEISNASAGGTMVEVLLPLSEPTASIDIIRPEREPRDHQGLVMVVDDEDFIREFAEEALQAIGLTTVGCSDGAEAVEVFAQHHHEIRLVLLDLVMPRLDGHQALKRFTEIDPSVPVILSSGYPGDTGVGHEIPDGATAFLGKPYRIFELQELVEQLLG
ncbi:MAG: cache domain-containing protein [Thermoanaerobaculales bacterium]|jgi:signal transduction histidine kinase|nr:cache domain-containing protein [Thermoanaerobaculales bacterium]